MSMRIFGRFTVALWLALSLPVAAEVLRMGAYYGPLPAPVDFERRDGYPLHYATWAGNLYLAKRQMDVDEWVGKMKTKMIKEALADAKAYAKKNGYTYYAVDNMRFQVVHTQEMVELYFDGNAVVWK